MAVNNLTPRQKMINMMYLVLTALLALNVSVEVLNAFRTVNDGISNSAQVLQHQNDVWLDRFKVRFDRDSQKVGPYLDKAERAKVLTAELYAYLDQYKSLMVKEAGGYDEHGDIKRNDDIDIATRMFVEKNGSNGKELRKRILDTRKSLVALVDDPNDRKLLEREIPLNAEAPKSGVDWEFDKFNHVPVIAAITIMSKFQYDLLSAESNIMEKLYSKIDAGDIKVNRMTARVLAPTSSILQGQEYKADIMVAAYSTTQQPKVYLGSFSSVPEKDEDGNYKVLHSNSEQPPLTSAHELPVNGGIANLSMAGAAPGAKGYTGMVRVASPLGGYDYYPFEGKYRVTPKAAVIFPTVMNVWYAGLDNPLDISVPGVAQEDLQVNIQGIGNLRKVADGKFIATASQYGRTKVQVSAKVDGKLMPMGEQEFRVLPIPNPVMTLNGLFKPGNITVGKAKIVDEVVPVMDNFPYPAKFNVVNYVFVYSKQNGGGANSMNFSGSKLPDNVKTIIRSLKPGDTFYIEKIGGTDPAGKGRDLGNMAFKIIG